MKGSATILAGLLFAVSGACAMSVAGQSTGQASGQAGAQAGASAGVQAGGTNAQSSGNASARTSLSAKPGALAAGTAMNAELSQAIDARKAKPGDSVTARATDNVMADGKTVLPKGSKLVGHVTQASARGKGDADSALGIQFDRAILKNGQEIPLHASIQALAAAREAAALGGDSLEAAGSGSGEVGTRGVSGGRGALGGVTGAAGGATGGTVNTVPRVAEDASATVNSTVNGTANAAGRATAGAAAGASGGLNAAGQLTSTSRGVFGLNGLNLDAGAAHLTQGSLITSAGKNVHLDSGTRMLLLTQAESSASAQK